MKIVVDENIPFAVEAFSQLGDVTLRPGRAITSDDCRGADLLVVRSITRVDRALLEGSRVRFVGTCTIGTDHLDLAWLEAQQIAVASAPGCNAISVAEYIVAALLQLRARHGLDLARLSIGIVGYGNVGKRVAAMAGALGMRVVVNDPPLAESAHNIIYESLDNILKCDVITLHVPLTKSGLSPTFHLVDSEFLKRMRPQAFLINTARGAVVDNTALKQALQAKTIAGAVLDVWENEPEIDAELLEVVDIGTPHIAGYSYDGKVNGTVQIYQAACRHVGVTPEWSPETLLPSPPVPAIRVEATGLDSVADAVSEVYDITADDANLREILTLPTSERGAYFDSLRKNYAQRREFTNARVSGNGAREPIWAGLGFQSQETY